MQKPNTGKKNLTEGLAALCCLFLLFLFAACSTEKSRRSGDRSPSPPGQTRVQEKNPPSGNSFSVVNSFPHDPQAFTQGFLLRDGFLYESTGLYGESSLRRTDPATGKILAQRKLPSEFFGEGITIMGDRLFQLTWKSRRGFIYRKRDLQLVGSFSYSTEGWGLTDDGKQLIMSDGTEKLYFLSPRTFDVTKVLEVRENGSPVPLLNELEYARGKIYCNIWRSDDIVVVDPGSGKVERRISLEALRRRLAPAKGAGVLNGIAWKSSSGTFLVTGKRWPRVFEVKLGSGSP